MIFLQPNFERLEKHGDYQTITRCLDHKRAAVRLQAFQILIKKVQKNDEDLYERLKALMDDRDSDVRTCAVLKFAEMGEEDLYDKLSSVFINGTVRDKIDLLRILAHRGTTGQEEVSNLLVMAINDKKDLVQIEAIRTMGILKDRFAVKHLLEKIIDIRFVIRLEACRALGKIGDDRAVDPLIGAMLDNNPEVRFAAREALGALGSERAMKALKDEPLMLLIKLMNENVAKRLEIVQYIGKQKQTDALPLLYKACQDEYKNIRIEAIRAVGAMRDLGAVELISRLIDDPYFDVRMEAVRTLEKLNDPRALAALERAFHDKNRLVVAEAKKSFYSLEQRLAMLKKL